VNKTLVLTRRAALASALTVAASGCFASFGATRALYHWNNSVSDSKWLKWLVFLVLIILPVYGLFILADVLVLNTIEFFSGKNPIDGGHADLGSGHTLDSKRTDDPNVIRHEHRKDGKLVGVIYVKRESPTQFAVLDEHIHVLSRVHLQPDGKMVVTDGAGKEVSSLSPQGFERVALALEAGASPTAAVHAELDASGHPAWASR